MKTHVTLFLMLFVAAFWPDSLLAQTKPVSGRVISEQLNPLEGVQITNSRTRVSTTTDGLGIFTIKALPGDPLIFSFPKYIGTRKVVKQASDPINVVLLNEIQDDFDSKLMDRKYKKLARMAEEKGSWKYIVQN